MTPYLSNYGQGQPFTAALSRQSNLGRTLSGTVLAVSADGEDGGVRPRRGIFLKKPTSKLRSVRVLIVDDHPLFADAIAECIKRTIAPKADVVQTTGFEEAVELVAAGPFDLVLLDYRMTGMQGLQRLRLMRDRFPELRIAMMFSGVADGPQILEAIQLGVAGFIPKDFSVPALIKSLELIFLGESFVPATALCGPEMSKEAAQASLPPASRRPRALTAREIEVLGYVEQGKSNREIADSIGTKDMTVAFHLKNAFRKLGVKNRTQAAAAMRKLGLGGKET